MRDTLLEQFNKMIHDKSFLIGSALAIPVWILNAKGWGEVHSWLIILLTLIIIAEWIVGSRLAKLSEVKNKTSEVAIDAVIRDGVIYIIVMAGWVADQLFKSGSLIFAILALAFIYHNLYSLTANLYVLGWDKHFPMWLFKWAENEIRVKKEKYFPTKK